jgi:antitoxin ParD1/3/4
MTAKKMSITLPEEMAALVAAKVASGEYASDSAVIQDGLRALLKRDAVVENWLQNRVAEAFDNLKANPDSAVSGNHVRDELLSAISQKVTR